MLRRPPAREVFRAPQEGISGLVRGASNGGVVNTAKAYGGGNAGSVRALSFVTTWLDMLQVQPVREQPKLISYSAAQPMIRWGHRRTVRTFMTASPRFAGRWAYVGFISRHFAERARMTGVATRQAGGAYTYTYPRFLVTPRTIALGPRSK